MPKDCPGNKGGKRKSISTRFVFLTLTLCQQLCPLGPKGSKMNGAHSLPSRAVAGVAGQRSGEARRAVVWDSGTPRAADEWPV